MDSTNSPPNSTNSNPQNSSNSMDSANTNRPRTPSPPPPPPLPSTPPSALPSALPSAPPSTPPAACTTRDQRLQIQTLHDAGLKYGQIREQLGFTFRQIQYALSHRITPKKRRGRPLILTQEQINEIITWICILKANRRTSWIKILIVLELNVSYYCIRIALRNVGFARRVARRKPSLSERNRIQRLYWAIEHLNWTLDDWKKILWSDETWVNGERHTKIYITRRAGEE